MRSFLIFLFLGLALQVSAWGFDAKDVIIAKKRGENGIVKIYPVTKDQAWEIAQAVFKWKMSNPVTLHPEENYMLSSIGIITCPCKTEVGVWVKRMDGAHTEVNVVTVGRVQKNPLTNIETFHDPVGPDFHKRFEQGVELVKSGKRLPDYLPVNK